MSPFFLGFYLIRLTEYLRSTYYKTIVQYQSWEWTNKNRFRVHAGVYYLNSLLSYRKSHKTLTIFYNVWKACRTFSLQR